ncbi:MAG: GNAT family N-acetyltransferase [Crocinitomicaceae bacterium]|nr:GNAT family N-acetyltransferase [Crocinitomicaceae bacterium]
MKIELATTKESIQQIEELGREIWTEHYTPIIGIEQVNYMLDKFQSARAITEQIGEGYLYYQLVEEGELIGYLAIQKREESLFLSKIYVRKDQRGKGFGRQAMEFVFDQAKAMNCEKVNLTVNKYNEGSIKSYEKMGFQNVGDAVFDIGEGFVMDDFLFEFRVLGSRC